MIAVCFWLEQNGYGEMSSTVIGRVIIWLAKHFVLTWGLVYLSVRIAFAISGQGARTFGIWHLTAAPFMFLWPVAEWVDRAYGHAAAGLTLGVLVACIYAGLDFVIWTIIRSARRNALASKAGQHNLGVGGMLDLASALIVRYAFPLWAVITAAGLFYSMDFRGDPFEASIDATILYGSYLLAVPLWPFLAVAGKAMQDPVIRAIVLSCFVIACVIADQLIKQKIRSWRVRKDAEAVFD
jgi:hypothetical protein